MLAARDWFDALESRSLFSATPFPALEALQNPSNPVIRLGTSMGDIDIEMFADVMPGLVAEYLAGLDRGLTCDYTFFHRSQPGFLQGGMFSFTRRNDIGAVAACSPLLEPIMGGAGLPNLERTVATGQFLDVFPGPGPFIFNLRDNSSTFDPAETVVFGRILDDRSWDVVQAISSLPVANLSGDGSFAGFYAGSFTSTPVTRAYNPGSDMEEPELVEPDLLVQNYDLAIIKPLGAPDFYRHYTFQPEGYKNNSIHEFIPIENPNDEPVWFELMARYEDRTFSLAPQRDDVIASGMIPAHSRGGVTIQIGGRLVDSAVSLANQPFAMELRSTLPLAATLSHYDFGVSLSSAFDDETATTWYFPEVAELSSDFLVWYNPGCDGGTVTVTLISDTGEEQAPVTFPIAALRRGGVDLRTLTSIPEGSYAARVDSTVPIIASRSHYGVLTNEGFAEAGSTGVGSSRGVIAIARDPGDRVGVPGIPTLSIYAFNPGEDEVSINVDVYEEGETTPSLSFPAAIVLAAGGAGRFEIELPDDLGPASAVYTSNGPVHASFLVRRPESGYGGKVPIIAGESVHFAEGFVDPDRVSPHELEEAIHLFNPFGSALGIEAQDATVQITFRYADGFEMTIERVVAGGTMSRVAISSLPEVIEQAEANDRFYYSIEVSSVLPILAQMLHIDVRLGTMMDIGGGFISAGSSLGMFSRLDELVPG